tara:strand:- start:328 stop:432 length:105 start_codon:yes stop_codon:yes gene_type:complete
MVEEFQVILIYLDDKSLISKGRKIGLIMAKNIGK